MTDEEKLKTAILIESEPRWLTPEEMAELDRYLDHEERKPGSAYLSPERVEELLKKWKPILDQAFTDDSRQNLSPDKVKEKNG